MSVMDRVAGLLADAGDLLQDMDDLTVSEALESGEAPDSADWRAELRCGWCGHNWHGLGCYTPPRYDLARRDVDTIRNPAGLVVDYIDTWAEHLSEVSEDGCGCRCDSSLVRLDDTWRPAVSPDDDYRAERIRRVAAQHGLDGWTAREVVRRGLVTRMTHGWPGQAKYSISFEGMRVSVEQAAESMRSLSRMTLEISVSVSQELVNIIYGGQVDGLSAELDQSAVLERARARRGSGPARPGPERSRRPRRVL